MHIPHHSHNGRRSAPQCGLLAGDFHHRTSRISSLPTSRTYPTPFFPIFNPNMTFAHHCTCKLHCCYSPIYPSMLLKRCVLLAHRIASYYYFFRPLAGFPHSAHCIFQFPHTFDLFPSTLHFSSFSFQYSGAGLFDNPVCILECRIFRNYRTDLQKIEGKSRNHLFHTQAGG